MNEQYEEKRTKGPLIYAIIGVSVLIIAVAGSAYAYFTASATADNNVSGKALQVNLGITLSKTAPTTNISTKDSLVPIYDGSVTGHTSQLQQAATASCKDSKNYNVCQIYKVEITNTGTDATNVDTTLSLTKNSVTNLKWATMSAATTVSTVQDSTSGNIATSTALSANGKETLYFMVYINNTGNAQYDTGDFSGTVTVTASNGAHVEATF